jgi:DNA polymerase IV (archaeal DinB-like DNA polymerase)
VVIVLVRIVLHVDLDCFYASVEKRDNPAYAEKPLVVGADPKGGGGRGVVLTASYEARKFGLHSGMPISRAYRACPKAIYIRPDFTRYIDASKQVMAILKQRSKTFQSGGLDEAYLDVSDICHDFDEAEQLATLIKTEIHDSVGITCSIGIGPTKPIAKIATDVHKPDGITTVTPDTIEAVLGHLDISAVSGIGKKTKQYYYDKGLNTIADAFNTPLPNLVFLIGPRSAKWLHGTLHGLYTSPVCEHHGRKSISKERTFSEDVSDYDTITTKLRDLNNKLHDSIREKGIFYKTVTLKIRFQGFETFDRSRSFARAVQDEGKTFAAITSMLGPFKKEPKKVRLVGIKLSNIEGRSRTVQKSILDFTRMIPS